MNKKVDFFLVGAAKCGTSAMFEYLIQHPKLFIPPKKELHYFGADLNYSVPRITSEEYLEYFKQASGEQLFGDCSVSYLLSKNAAQEILDYNPEAKIIIMARNPVEMLQSLHAELVYDGMEKETDLEKALNLEPERKKGKALPKLYSIPLEFLYYSEAVALYTQAKRYLDVFDSDKVLIIEQQSLLKQPKEVLQSVTAFLTVEPFDFIKKEEINPHKKIRFSQLNYFQNQLSEKGKSFFRKVVPSKRFRKYVFNKIWELNAVKSKKENLPIHLQLRIKNMLATETEGLNKLLKRFPL